MVVVGKLLILLDLNMKEYVEHIVEDNAEEWSIWEKIKKLKKLCFRMFFFKFLKIILNFSCMHADQLVPKERPFVCQSVNTSQLIQIVKCCRDGSFCNDKKVF